MDTCPVSRAWLDRFDTGMNLAQTIISAHQMTTVEPGTLNGFNPRLLEGSPGAG
jgi:hypothetical protein